MTSADLEEIRRRNASLQNEDISNLVVEIKRLQGDQLINDERRREANRMIRQARATILTMASYWLGMAIAFKLNCHEGDAEMSESVRAKCMEAYDDLDEIARTFGITVN